MKNISVLLIAFLLCSCASVDDGNYANLRAKTQCPINYHLQQNTTKKAAKDKYTKSHHYSVEFKCVADSDKDIEFGVTYD